MPARVTTYLIATVLVGVGVALMVRAKLGVAPNDVLNTGLAETVGVGVGTASWITGAVAMALAWVLGRPPRVPTLAGSVIVGLSVNATMAILPGVTPIAARVLLLVCGLVAVWTGIVGVVVGSTHRDDTGGLGEPVRREHGREARLVAQLRSVSDPLRLACLESDDAAVTFWVSSDTSEIVGLWVDELPAPRSPSE